MATVMTRPRLAGRSDERFFFISALIMAAILVAGFSFQHAMGRSSFHAPLYVHAHAVIFFGWTVLYVVQNATAQTGSRTLHRRLGWLSVGWIPAMLVMGFALTVIDVRGGQAPFFFQPAYFLVLDPLSLMTFAGLAGVAIARRRQTQWHRRLMFCAMTILLGPGIGRLLPMPLFMPHAGWAVFLVIMLFPIAGVIRDRRHGRVHPGWWWGIATIVAMQLAVDLVAFSPAGPALYRAVTAGSPGASLAPLAFKPFPGAHPRA